MNMLLIYGPFLSRELMDTRKGSCILIRNATVDGDAVCLQHAKCSGSAPNLFATLSPFGYASASSFTASS